jgi:integrase
VPKALTIKQTRQLLTAAKDDAHEALYVLAITTGMRQGELLALTWIDIDFTTGKLQVRRSLSRARHTGTIASELKTVSSRRCIQLTTCALDALQRHACQQQQKRSEAEARWNKESWIFCNTQGKPLHVANLIRRSFRPLLEKAGLPHAFSRFTPYDSHLAPIDGNASQDRARTSRTQQHSGDP